ncbi:winged helix DNA-binding domain-containing protein [Arthrobacter sp. H5]|uniref:winged helix DNA-binding domain-containing protein n=1 Tax=Arthrobacter sp. H5 TaxID=1267973 RepID=UPI000480ADB5|nr:winged helix DNA-binding domain-containing protein [Arthrobacter sp. H5]
MDVTWEQACARRLERQGLGRANKGTTTARGRIPQMAGSICGAHAQVMSAAEHSLGLRVPGVTRRDVRAALWEERSLVKSFGPRGTVHLLPAADVALWMGALAAIPTPPSSLPKHARMTPDQTGQVFDAIAAALDGRELTREELSREVIAATGPWAGDPVVPAFQGNGPRWMQAISYAGRRGMLCFGPNRGRNITYTNLLAWVPGFEPAAPLDAVEFAVRRFLHAYGPATPRQFAQWIGCSPAWAVGTFESLGDRLESVGFEGGPAWINAGDGDFPDEPSSGTRLLPYFDAYGIGSHPRPRVFAGQATTRALGNGQAGTMQVLLVDGVVGGVWHQKRSGKRIAVTVEAFRRLGKRQLGELEAQADLLGVVMEGEVSLALGEVTVGHHA